MPDPVDPIPPTTTPTPVTGSGTQTTSTGLPTNVAAALACIPLVGGIIFYVLEKTDSFVRFYAMQSIIFGGAWIIFDIVARIVQAVFATIPAIGGLFVVLWGLIWAVVTIGFLIVFVITVIKAFTGVRWEIPYIGPVARAQVDGPTAV
ncbi:MAG TPA: hypothetical protein VK993_02780 [Chthoniobacterales bacterium]|nr:hypothetical protein [Chthoniobacterales bacterium]